MALVMPGAEAAALAEAVATLRAAVERELARPPAERGQPHRQETPDRPAPPRGGDPLARRILCLWLPDLAIERWRIATERRGDPVPDDLAVALAAEGAHGPVITAASRAARAGGVAAGMRVVDARALLPGLRVDHADPGADRAALERLMRWARRWCPWTAVEGTTGLVMDTTGSAHLRGGEARLMEEIEGRLAILGLSARIAIAPTLGAAWALARLAPPRSACGPEDLAARMAPLPVRALRLTPETVLLLQRLGLKTVGDLMAVPRISLARRFSRAGLAENPLLRLDQMFGRLAEPVTPPDDPPCFTAELALAEPILDPTAHLPALAERLCAQLLAAGQGARRIALALYRTDGEVVGTEVATAMASRDPRHLVRLFDGRLERVDPGWGFDLIALAATVAENLAPGQTRLDGRGDGATELAALTDRLAARFGARALTRPAARGSHIPERDLAWVPAMAGRPAPAAPAGPPRPLRLFDPPEEVRVIYAVPEGPPAQFVWRRVTRRVTRFAGPERIAPEWWRDAPSTRLRDYYRIEDHLGLRLWLYREGLLGDGRGETPRWFVHGTFA